MYVAVNDSCAISYVHMYVITNSYKLIPILCKKVPIQPVRLFWAAIDEFTYKYLLEKVCFRLGGSR